MAETTERRFGARMGLAGYTREHVEHHVRRSTLERARRAYPELGLEPGDVNVVEVPANPELGLGAHLRGEIVVRVELPATGSVRRG